MPIITRKALKLSAAALMAGVAFGSNAAIAAADTPSQPPAIAAVNNSIADQAPLSAQNGQPSTLIVSSLAPTAGTAPTATAQSWSLVVNKANQTTSATAPSTGGWS